MSVPADNSAAPLVGMAYFDGNGRKVEVIAAIEQGFVVAPIINVLAGGWGDDFDETREERSERLELVPCIYPDAPTEIYAEEISALKAKIEDERQVLATLRDDIHAATAERRQLLAKLSSVPALKHIEAAIEGRFTHIVSRAYGPPYAVGTTEEVLASSDRYSKGLKLLTLFGDAKGDLQWRISHYPDGSGGASDAWPFTSEEEALAFLRKQVAEDIAYHSAGHPDSRPYYLVALCKQAREIGVGIPAAVVKMEQAEARKVADHALAEARKGLETAQQRLAVAEAQAAMVPA